MASTCAVPECTDPAKARGWCNPHYQSWRRHGDPEARAWIRYDDPREALRARREVDPATGCWLWTGKLSEDGYGRINVRDASGTARQRQVHRLSYVLNRFDTTDEDEIAGLDIDHECRRHACFLPEHLTARSHADNVRRTGGYAGRSLCRAGLHDITTSEAVKVLKNGNRTCLGCLQARYGTTKTAVKPRMDRDAELASGTDRR